MIFKTLAFIIVIAITVYVIYLHMDGKKQYDARIKSIKPGKVYCFRGDESDPWLDDTDLYTVLEIRNGWVRYANGVHTNLSAVFSIRRRRLTEFDSLYTEYDP